VTSWLSEVWILFCFLLNNVKKTRGVGSRCPQPVVVVVVDGARQCFPWLCAEQQFQLDTASGVMKGGCSPWPGFPPQHAPACLTLPPGSCHCARRRAPQCSPGLTAACSPRARCFGLRFLRRTAVASWPTAGTPGPKERGRRGGCRASGEPVLRRPEGSSRLRQRSVHTQSTVSFLLHKLARTNLVISSAALTGACLQGVIMQA